jgi:hypothetical protein
MYMCRGMQTHASASYATYFDVLAVEPTLPRYIDLEDKKKIYQWSEYPITPEGKPADYPPHLKTTDTIPRDQKFTPFGIFSTLGLLETQVILQKITPDKGGFLGKTKKWLIEKERAAAFGAGGSPQVGATIDDVWTYNKYHRKTGTDITKGGNLGLLDDWFSDRRFADQQFTGTNPTTLELAGKRWLGEFVEAAKTAGEAKWAAALQQADPSTLYVQDCSYFRKAVGVTDPTATLKHQQPSSDLNWAVGAVSLFQLFDSGMLHPIAICIDYKGTMAASVTLFNKRTTPSDSSSKEKDDYPWRYAKTCAQVSDWLRHEVGVHLTHAHLVEEVTIVAANRTLPMNHPVYRILSPHWYKTLSLNAAARSTLLPQIIVELVGISPEQAYSFTKSHFENFDFVANYVPNDLKRRGFPNTEGGLGIPKYRNYPYAKNMVMMWNAIRTYVKSMLLVYYDVKTADATVAADEYVQNWSNECRGPGRLSTFPEIKTLDGLTDAITMCIHIAAPFHNTVNYLQNFYQVFVPAKPPALCRAPPTTRAELLGYKEVDMIASLPINRQREWLLAAQVPWLLSFQVDGDRSLLNYAASQWNVYKYKRGKAEETIRDVSEVFYRELQVLQKKFFYNSQNMSEGSIPYMVMDPGVTAVSILI